MQSLQPSHLEYLLLGSLRECLPNPPLVYQHLEVKDSFQFLQLNAWSIGDAQCLLTEKKCFPFENPSRDM